MTHTYDSIREGDEFTIKRFISRDDVNGFADITGDDNPIHIDISKLKDTRFDRPIVHGVLLLGVISKVLGHDFPGPGSIAVAISAKFLRPVYVDSEVRVTVKIVGKVESRKHVKAKVYVHTEGKLALGGEATLVPPPED
jgi:acyl dehydratase